MEPTAEQLRAIDLFQTGGSLAIEAGAGTGKTSTLVLIAEAAGLRRGQYVAFNKALVEDGRGKFPTSVATNTAHSLAFRAVGREYKHRLDLNLRMTQREVAQKLGIRPIEITDFAGEPKHLAPGFLAGLVSRTIANFCQSDSEALGAWHVPYIEGLDPVVDGVRTHAKNAEVKIALLPYAKLIWADLQSKHGWAPYKHDHYLKAWQLSGPRIDADYILFDEAQDANPVIAAIVAAQTHAQRVYVGDSQQEIYAWTGAVNALGSVKVDNRTFLTQSFRFGKAVADAANLVLSRIPGADLRLTGNPAISSSVESVSLPRAILTRTNAEGLSTLLRLQQDGRRAHLLGGSTDLVGFARGADDLLYKGSTSYPQLATFDSWDSVRRYVEEDEDGSDMRLLVKLVDTFGPATIIEALEQMPLERDAEITISTAHKSKGRQWDSVRLASDFPSPDPDAAKPGKAADLRLLYVAVTRAQRVLDVDTIPYLRPLPDDE